MPMAVATQARPVIRRRRRVRSLTPRQLELRQYLLSEGVSEAMAKRLTNGRGKQFQLEDLRKKIDAFKSIELDPNRHGVGRIPVSMFEKELSKPLSELTKKRRKSWLVMWQLEDAHAAKKLNKLLPGWKKLEAISHFRASNLLKKVEACIAIGIKPTPYIMANYGIKAIESGRAKAPHSLNKRELRKQIGPSRLVAETKQEIKLRVAIAEQLMARPHLAANTTWIFRHFKAQGIPKNAISQAITSMVELGAIVRSDGYVRVSKYFRTGNKTWKDYSENRW